MLEFFDSDTLLQSAAHELIVMIIKIELQSLTKAIIFELFYYINGYFRV